MKMIKRAVKVSVITIGVAGSSVFAQSLNDAKKAIDAEQYQKAKGILKGLIAAQPNEADNYFFLGNVYLETDYADSAKAVYTKGAGVDAKSGLNLVGLGALDLESGNAGAAKANFDKAVAFATKKDNDPYLYVGKAYLSASKPDYATALTYLEKAKAMDEKDAEVYLALGDAYRGLKKNSEAYGAYGTAYDLNKSLLRSKVELGIVTKRAKAFKEATDEFNKVLATDPNYAPAYRELAETYLEWSWNASAAEKQGLVTKAVENYKKYLDMTDRSLDSRLRYADFLVFARDYKTLEQESAALTQSAQANPRVYRYLGISAFENGNFPASAQAYKDFFSKVEEKRVIPLDYAYLGKAQYKTGDAQALANLSKAVDLDSTIAEEVVPLAAAAFKEKKYNEAAQLYALAVQGPKATLEQRYYVGFSHYWDYATKSQAGQNPDIKILTNADSAFSYVNKYAPTFASAYLYRARTNRLIDEKQNGETVKGLSAPYYEKFIEVVGAKPENLTDAKNKKDLVEAYNNLGAYYIKSDSNKAKGYFQKTLALDPANQYATEVMKSLASQ
jgi:tetratricopeptide (TPR) repeat protein